MVAAQIQSLTVTVFPESDASGVAVACHLPVSNIKAGKESGLEDTVTPNIWL